MSTIKGAQFNISVRKDSKKVSQKNVGVNLPDINQLSYDDLIILSTAYSRVNARKGSAAFHVLTKENRNFLSDKGQIAYQYIEKYSKKPTYVANIADTIDKRIDEHEKKLVKELKITK